MTSVMSASVLGMFGWSFQGAEIPILAWAANAVLPVVLTLAVLERK